MAMMSIDYRDKQGGHTNQFYVGFKPGTVKALRRLGHKQARQRTKRDLEQRVEPAPIYPQETTYFD